MKKTEFDRMRLFYAKLVEEEREFYEFQDLHIRVSLEKNPNMRLPTYRVRFPGMITHGVRGKHVARNLEALGFVRIIRGSKMVEQNGRKKTVSVFYVQRMK